MIEEPKQGLPHNVWSLTLGFILFAILMLIVAFLFTRADAAPRLAITVAQWTASKAELSIQGSAPAGADVVLTDAVKGTMLGSVTADTRGNWTFSLAGLASPPTRVAAQAGGLTSERAVRSSSRGKPSEGGGTGGGKSHAGRFTAYEGTKTCLPCHKEQALEAHAAVHYQWQGETPDLIDSSTPKAGKLGGINDFCIYPDINWIGKLTNVNGVQVDGGCARCHAGLGQKPTAEPTQAQLENIDCLVCHSEPYKRTVEAASNGTFRFVPDTAKMTVSLLDAATDLTLPSSNRCLNCHTRAGGGDNHKRGDIEEAHRNATREFDVHLASKASGGAGLSCLDCHKAANHKIAGRGSDLRERDLPDPVTCNSCHTETPHGDRKIDKHTARVNCTVCHIPTFAKKAPTDMDRDWSKPGVLNPATGLYEPSAVMASGVNPEYRFFNGKSYFYEFGDVAFASPSGRVVMSAPDGSIQDKGAKIHAFKHHLASQPRDKATARLLPLKIGKFFMTGQVDGAIKDGAAGVGWAYAGHDFAKTERYLGLFHEVSPKDQALSCTNCHTKPGRLDFAALGYTPVQARNGRPLCASCHKDKTNEWSGTERFSKVHAKHVEDKKLDCSSCHGFSAALR
ncbi:MAG: hypothetical protein AB1512_29340 [Thermodesulfobacteriota bacterium]